MSESLYALVSEAQTLIQHLAESGGELTPEIELALTNIDAKLPAKIDGYATILERLVLEEEYWTGKADQYYAIAKGCKDGREYLKDSLKAAAKALGTDELIGADQRFKISNGAPSLVIDQSKLPDGYLKKKVTFEPDKDKIKADLIRGKEVEGAIFKESVKIQAYPNKKGKGIK